MENRTTDMIHHREVGYREVGCVKRKFEVVKTWTGSSPQLPCRKTAYSAGYDFFLPEDVFIPPHGSVTIKTGIKVCMPWNEVLLLFIRSSLGIKRGLALPNAVGVIDADYYENADNDGEIMAKLDNHGDEAVELKRGDSFMQGIFVKYFVTDGDTTEAVRQGGIGSTGR